MNERKFRRNVLRQSQKRVPPLAKPVHDLNEEVSPPSVPVVDSEDPRFLGTIGWLSRLLHGEVADKNPATETIQVFGRPVVLSRMSGEELEKWTRLRVAAADLGSQLTMFSEVMDRESEEHVTEFKDMVAHLIALGMVMCSNATGLDVERIGELPETKRRFIIDRQGQLNNDDAANEFFDPYWKVCDTANRLPWPAANPNSPLIKGE